MRDRQEPRPTRPIPEYNPSNELEVINEHSDASVKAMGEVVVPLVREYFANSRVPSNVEDFNAARDKLYETADRIVDAVADILIRSDNQRDALLAFDSVFTNHLEAILGIVGPEYANSMKNKIIIALLQKLRR